MGREFERLKEDIEGTNGIPNIHSHKMIFTNQDVTKSMDIIYNYNIRLIRGHIVDKFSGCHVKMELRDINSNIVLYELVDYMFSGVNQIFTMEGGISSLLIDPSKKLTITFYNDSGLDDELIFTLEYLY